MNCQRFLTLLSWGALYIFMVALVIHACELPDTVTFRGRVSRNRFLRAFGVAVMGLSWPFILVALFRKSGKFLGFKVSR